MFPKHGPSGLASGSPQSLPKGYRHLSTLGKGSFGVVQKAERLQDRAVVAVKCLWREYTSWQECLQLREVKALQRLRHANIVTLYEMLREDNALYFVFEFCPSTLHEALKSCHAVGRSLPNEQINKTIQQVLSGVAHMHRKGFFHRDLKPDNLLLSASGDIKIADFGLAREMRSAPPYTAQCGTLWYRAPETLLPGIPYSAPIDLWAAGVIFAELYLQHPLFPAQSDVDQFYRHCQFLGTPTIEGWAQGVQVATTSNLRLPQCRGVSLRHKLPQAPSPVVSLMGKLIKWNPTQRFTADQALKFVGKHFPSLSEKSKEGGTDRPPVDILAGIATDETDAAVPSPNHTGTSALEEAYRKAPRLVGDETPENSPGGFPASQEALASSSRGSSASVGQLLDEIDAESHDTELSVVSQSSLRISPKVSPRRGDHSPHGAGPAVSIVDQLLANDLKELSISAPDVALLTRRLSTSRTTTISDSANLESLGSSISMWDQQTNSLRGSLAEYRFGATQSTEASMDADGGVEEESRRRRVAKDRSHAVHQRNSNGSQPELVQETPAKVESTQVEILSPRKAAEMITSDVETASEPSPLHSMQGMPAAPQPPPLYGHPGQSECFRRVSDNHRRNSIVDCVIRASDPRGSCDDDGLQLTDVTTTNADVSSNASQSPHRAPKNTCLEENETAAGADDNSPKANALCSGRCAASVQFQEQLGEMRTYMTELQAQMVGLQGVIAQLCGEVRTLCATNKSLQEQVSQMQSQIPLISVPSEDQATLRQNLGDVTGRVEVLEGQLAGFVKRASKAAPWQAPSPGISPTVLWANGQSQLLVSAPKLDISLRRMRRGQARESPYGNRRLSNRSIATDSGALTPGRLEADGECKFSPAVPTTIFVAACTASMSATSEPSSASCSPSNGSMTTPRNPSSPLISKQVALDHLEPEPEVIHPSAGVMPSGLITPQTPAQPPARSPGDSNAPSPRQFPGPRAAESLDGAGKGGHDQTKKVEAEAEVEEEAVPTAAEEGGDDATLKPEGWQVAQEAWLRKEIAPRRPSFSDGRHNPLLRASPHRPPLYTRSPPPPFPSLANPCSPEPPTAEGASAQEPIELADPPSPDGSPMLQPFSKLRHPNPILLPLQVHRQPIAIPTPPAPVGLLATVPEPTALIHSMSSTAPPNPTMSEEDHMADSTVDLAETWPRSAYLQGRRALSCGDFAPTHLKAHGQQESGSPAISPKGPQTSLESDVTPTSLSSGHLRLRRFSGVLP
eukprot:GGOE01021446.1.p1 GENE.GGOE01021446.1~~GGOE01021446.1.p1  ORF type:complete len:1251 (-),score=235.44 GGOE01021446.1:683-4435(-)